MKVLYLHQHFCTPSGAVGNRSYEQSKALIARGHQVLMVCGSYDGAVSGLEGDYVKGVRRGHVDQIEVLQFELPVKNSDSLVRRAFYFLVFALRTIRVALKEEYDIVFATSTPLTAAIPGIVAKLVRRKIFVVEIRDLWPELPRAMGAIRNPIILGLLSLLEWSSYRSANAAIGLSPGIVDGIKSRSSKSLRIELIPNGADIDAFSTPRNNDSALNTFKDSDFVAIFPGAHGVANGLDAVLDAAAVLISRQNSNIKFLFVGTGKEKPRLLERASQEKLDNCVFMNSMPKPELGQYMRRANVGLMVLADVPAFYYGTSPNKFFDYIAAELPVLINYPGWIANIVNDEKIGIAIAPQDPTQFANALQEMNSTRDLLKEMSANSKRLASDVFDRRLLSGRFVDFIERVYSTPKNR